MTSTIAIICNTALHVQRARTTLIKALMSHGARIVLISPYDPAVQELEKMGVMHEHIDISQYGTNPIREAAVFLGLRAILKRDRPAVCLCYTIKANTIGALAAQSLGIPVINNIAGAGRAFEGAGNIKRTFFRALYSLSLRRSARVFFQNSDDMKFFRESGMVQEMLARRLPGSGVDLQRFRLSPEFPKEPVFLFIGRLLLSKGAMMYIEAAKEMISREADARFLMAGERLDEKGYVTAEALQSFADHERCTYLGQVPPHEIEELLASCSFFVLPSFYGEGVPRTLLEAGAVGRPIIATDNVGCRDVIRHKVNGLKIAPRDQKQLVDAMIHAAHMEREKLLIMGRQSRAVVEMEFDERTVIEAYLKECSQYLASASLKSA